MNNTKNKNKKQAKPYKIAQLDIYKAKKLANQETLKYIFAHVSQNTFETFDYCHWWILREYNEDMTKGRTIKKIACNNRFCSLCATNMAKKEAIKISACLQYIAEEHKKAFVLLTLTAPSVKGEQLQEQITKFAKSFDRLFGRNEILKISHGFIRKLEITYNKEKYITDLMWHGDKHKGGHRKPTAEYFIKRGLQVGERNPNFDTFHVHYHVIIAVNKSYFTGRNYLNRNRWLELWQEAMNDSTITQVDIRAIKMIAKGGLEYAAFELAKYTAKNADYNVNQRVFDFFYRALKRRQVLTFGGLFKEAVKKFKNGELDKYIPEDLTKYTWEILYRWNKDEYKEEERKRIELPEVIVNCSRKQPPS